MDYSEALKLFGFTGNFTKEELKKRYLELSKKYHPDLNGDEEMMKKVNSAYEVLKSCISQYKTAKKQDNYDELLIKYYNKLKEKVGAYASKTVYLSDTLEFKYANAIDDVIKTFTLEKTTQLINFKYYVVAGSIKDLFKSYKNEILKNVPEFWISKFEPINDNCSFDAYVNEVNKIRTKYEKVDKNLDKIILSMFKDKKVNSKILEEIVVLKEIILKEIVDEKITIEDGINKLQAEIKTRILRNETLNNKIWDTYKAIMNNFNKRMMKLKPTDIEDINIAMIVFNRAMAKLKAVQLGTEDEKVLSTLGSLTFTNNDELKESEYELYITANLSDNEETEIVLKKGEVGNLVSFLKKFPSGMAEEVFMTKEEFYKKYNNFKGVLKNLDFLGDKGYIQYLNTKFITTALYYYENTGCYILLTENDKILLVSFNEFHSLNTHATDTASRTYKDKQALYDRFYNSFLKNKKEMKFKNNENNILKREKNKENI
jgi:hypothetical protein